MFTQERPPVGARGSSRRGQLHTIGSVVKLQVTEDRSDPPHRLLRFIWLLSKDDESKPLEVSRLFDRILYFSSKGYLDYGFKPGKWSAGGEEFVMRSEGFVSDLGFLARQGYIQMKDDSGTVLLLP